MVFHYLARAVISAGSSIMVARQIGAGHTFLPGGHIEFGEPARKALRREICEETGLSVEIGTFLGAVEGAFEQDGQAHAEINLVFASHLPNADANSVVKSNENHLEFFWVPRAEVAAWNLLPIPMRALVRDHQCEAAFWGSTLE